MERRRTSRMAWGVILIAAGLVLLGVQLFGLPEWWDPATSWPLIVIGIGALLLVIGALTRTAELAVPACVVGGIGLLLYYQNATGDWASWAYAWTLIPGFVGAGMLLAGMLSGWPTGTVAAGGWLIFISLVLFVIFGSFFGPLGLFGTRRADVMRYWPVLLIFFGILALLRGFTRRHRRQGSSAAPDDLRVEE